MKYSFLRCLVVSASVLFGLSAHAQDLNWSNDVYDPYVTNVGGTAGRDGVPPLSSTTRSGLLIRVPNHAQQATAPLRSLTMAARDSIL